MEIKYDKTLKDLHDNYNKHEYIHYNNVQCCKTCGKILSQSIGHLNILRNPDEYLVYNHNEMLKDYDNVVFSMPAELNSYLNSMKLMLRGKVENLNGKNIRDISTQALHLNRIISYSINNTIHDIDTFIYGIYFLTKNMNSINNAYLETKKMFCIKNILIDLKNLNNTNINTILKSDIFDINIDDMLNDISRKNKSTFELMEKLSYKVQFYAPPKQIIKELIYMQKEVKELNRKYFKSIKIVKKLNKIIKKLLNINKKIYNKKD